MSHYMASEEEALQIVQPYLQALCRDHWRYLEYEDRLGEVQYLFVCAWRQLPTNTGHFLRDFEQICYPYMEELNKTACARYFKERSMDSGIICRRKESTPTFNLHQLLAMKEDGTEPQVEEFLSSLAPAEQDILRALLEGQTRAELARRAGVSSYRLGRMLEALGQRYLEQYRV